MVIAGGGLALAGGHKRTTRTFGYLKVSTEEERNELKLFNG